MALNWVRVSLLTSADLSLLHIKISSNEDMKEVLVIKHVFMNEKEFQMVITVNTLSVQLDT